MIKLSVPLLQIYLKILNMATVQTPLLHYSLKMCRWYKAFSIPLKYVILVKLFVSLLHISLMILKIVKLSESVSLLHILYNRKHFWIFELSVSLCISSLRILESFLYPFCIFYNGFRPGSSRIPRRLKSSIYLKEGPFSKQEEEETVSNDWGTKDFRFVHLWLRSKNVHHISQKETKTKSNCFRM